ncbi:MAG: DUF5710 domain-containing protein [Acidimicrobiales bacterium]
MERIWLDVPFSEKDKAKALGARWDPARKRWYAPRQGMAALDDWAATPPLPEVLPGEDRAFGSGLFVDLVPASCWFTNARSCVAEIDWERLRRMVCGRAGWACEACGDGEDREASQWLAVHERWEYLEAQQVQRLRRLICLCSPCHTATHIGLAGLRGKRDTAIRQLRRVNGWTTSRAEAHVTDAFAIWRARSAKDWTLDLSILTDAGVSLRPPPDASGRRGIADATLRANDGGS